MTIHCWIGSVAEMSGGPASRSCRDLVDRAEALALTKPDEPLHIAALCCALAVSERTLRKAFHKIYGLPPHRHLRLLRLASDSSNLDDFRSNTAKCLAKALRRRFDCHPVPSCAIRLRLVLVTSWEVASNETVVWRTLAPLSLAFCSRDRDLCPDQLLDFARNLVPNRA